jgi:hypothetical protein
MMSLFDADGAPLDADGAGVAQYILTITAHELSVFKLPESLQAKAALPVLQQECDIGIVNASLASCRGEPAVCCWDGCGGVRVYSLLRLRELGRFSLRDHHTLLSPNSFQVLEVGNDGRTFVTLPLPAGFLLFIVDCFLLLSTFVTVALPAGIGGGGGVGWAMRLSASMGRLS